ncbi:DUF3761 domain-containing protein [Candidatus Peregrinibacteria bacterium]|nr:DUF3761 domain-containing protein [Candidatus Peregrinibacteria bacterium]
MKKLLSSALIAILALTTSNVTFADYGKQTKTSSCQAINGLPDPACTPGAVLTTDSKVICVTGYTKTVRHVSLKTKKDVFAEYGIPYSKHGDYEVDHLISLELGGSNDISNLWPELTKGDSGSLIKDKLENSLHSQICNEKLSVTDAQSQISSDWVTYWAASGKSSASTKITSDKSAKTVSVVKQGKSTTPVDSSIPVGATGKCKDGTYTEATNHKGACSHHGGVEKWL